MTHMIWSFAVKIDFHTKYEIYCVPKTQRGCYQVGMRRLRSCTFFPHFQFLRNRYVNVALYQIKYLIKCKWNFIFIKKGYQMTLSFCTVGLCPFCCRGNATLQNPFVKMAKVRGERWKGLIFILFAQLFTLQLHLTLWFNFFYKDKIALCLTDIHISHSY